MVKITSPWQEYQTRYLCNVEIRYPLSSGHDFINGVHHCLFLVADTDLPGRALIKEGHVHGNIREGKLLHVYARIVCVDRALSILSVIILLLSVYRSKVS